MENEKDNLRSEGSPGALTAKIGFELSLHFKDKGLDVLFDHSRSTNNVGRVVSWFEYDTDADYKRGVLLSYVDIAIVKQNSNDVVALIEIEETNITPKILLGDVFGVLMGDHIRFPKRKTPELVIGKDTILIVVGKNEGIPKKHIKYVRDKVEKIKPALGTKNAEIREVFIERFSNEADLFALLIDKLNDAQKVK
jgi:hypothetical protein